jgi:hypothetical protein
VWSLHCPLEGKLDTLEKAFDDSPHHTALDDCFRGVLTWCSRSRYRFQPQVTFTPSYSETRGQVFFPFGIARYPLTCVIDNALVFCTLSQVALA